MRSPLLLLAVLGVACGAPPPAADAPASWIQDRLALFEERNADQTRSLRLEARDQAGIFVPVARLAGVRLDASDTPDGAAAQPFASIERTATSLLARCVASASHRITVELTIGADGVDVEVTDHIGLPCSVRELSVEYDLLGPGTVEEAFAPQLTPTPDHLVPDAAFHLPLGWLRAGRHALALLVDTQDLARSRLLPQAVRLDPAEGTLRHGCFAWAERRQGLRSVYDLAAEGQELGGVDLTFRHQLQPDAAAAPQQSLMACLDRIWQSSVAPWLQCAGGRDARSWARTRADLLAGLDERWVPWRSAGLEVGLWRSEGTVDQATLRISWDHDPARAATAIASVATGDADRRERQRANAALQFLLDVRRVGDLAPSRIEVTRATEYRAVGPDDGRDGHQGLLHTLDASWHALWLWRARRQMPGLATVIAERCGKTADFLLANQTDNGAFPAFFHNPPYLQPVRDRLFDQGAESAGAALFLAEYGAEAGRPEALAAAVRTLRLLAELRGDRAWLDSRLDALSTGLATGDGWWPAPASCVGRTFGALLAARLAQLLPAASAEHLLAQDLLRRQLRELTRFQQCWRRPWQPADRLGALRATNLDAGWNDAITGLAAEAFLAGYDQSGDLLLLQRGAMALRAAVAAADAAGRLEGLCASTSIGNVWGQGIVDATAGVGVGLDALWIEDVRLDGDVLALHLLSDAGIDRARIVFRRLPPNAARFRVRVAGQEFTATAAELQAGLELPVTVLPAVHYLPPAEHERGAEFRPWITFDGDWPADTTAQLVTEDAAGRHEWPLHAVGNRLLPTPSADHRDLRFQGHAGTTIATQVLVRRGAAVAATPPVGRARLLLSDFACIDAGDDDEHTLVQPGRSQPVRSSDGSEGCRRLPAGSAATWLVPVHPGATTLELAVDVIGGALVTARAPGQSDPGEERSLHTDEQPVPRRRQLMLTVQDRRLWTNPAAPGDDAVLLTFTAMGAPLEVLRIGHRSSGSAATTAGNPVQHSPVVAKTLRVAVLPLRIDELPPLVASHDQIELAWTGGAEYVVTPAPMPQATTGSVAHLLTQLSGGATALITHVLPPLTLPSSRLDRDALQVIGEQLGKEKNGDLPDVVVLLHGGDLPLPPVAAPGLPPLVPLAERRRDGSFFATGDALAAVLRARFPNLFADLEPPDLGAFGELAFAGAGTGHRPNPMPGVQLLSFGYADSHDVDALHRLDEPDLKLPVIHVDRAFLRLQPRLQGRGDLIVEDRCSGPRHDEHGLLFYWDLRGRPVHFATQRDAADVQLLRLQADESLGPSPFMPASLQSLLPAAAPELLLDAASAPQIATPQGDAPWALRVRHSGERGELSLLVRNQELDGWSPPARTDLDGLTPPTPVTPLRFEGPLRLEMTPGTAVATAQPLPPSQELQRLFVRVQAEGEGEALLQLGIDGRELVRVRTAAGRDGLAEIDLPAGGRRLDLRCTVAPDSKPVVVVLRQCTSVPRQRAFSVLTPSPIAAATEPSADGVVHSRGATLVADGDGVGRLELPLVTPPGNSYLRLLGGLQEALPAGSEGLLTIEMVRQPDPTTPVGHAVPTESIRLLHELRLRRGDGRDTPWSAQLWLPPQERGDLWFLRCTWRAATGTRLDLQTVELVEAVTDETVPHVVVGGGRRGLRRAVQLLAAGGPDGVQVVEATPRPGGSLHTQRSEGFVTELGHFAFPAAAWPELTAGLAPAPPPQAMQPAARSGWRWQDGRLHPLPLTTDLVAPRGGCEDLAQVARRTLGGALRLGRPVVGLDRDDAGFALTLGGQVPTRLRTGAVTLAVPMPAAVALLAPFAPHFDRLATRLLTEPRAYVHLGYWQGELDAELAGYGILADADPTAVEAIFCTNVFAGRAQAGKFLARVELHGDVLAGDDEAVATAAAAALRRWTGLATPPILRRVHRFAVAVRDGAHVECRTRLADLVDRCPGLAVAGDD